MKRALSVLLSLCFILSLMPLTVFAEPLGESGTCGDSVSYSFDSSTGTLTLSGTGATSDYDWQNSPFNGRSEIQKIVIDSGVTAIGNNIFRNCDELGSIDIPDSVTSIGTGAFRYTGLPEFTLPKGVTNLGDFVFMGSDKLTSLSVEEGNTVYDSRDNCKAIVKTAENKLLFGCNETVIPESITNIEKYAFFGAKGITDIRISKNITQIGDDAFGSCSSVLSVTVDEENAVYDSRNGCNAIIESATDTLVFGCRNTVIPDGIKAIGTTAFDDCSGLSAITIPESVTAINDFAFYGCGLTSVVIPAAVKEIGYGVFSGCSALKNITVDAENAVYDSRDNCNAIIETASNKLITGCPGAIVPKGTVSIRENAFEAFYTMKRLSIPLSVEHIEDGAFTDCGLLDVYYEGTEADWNAITIDDNNEALTNAIRHYNKYEITSLTVTSEAELIAALNKSEVVDEISIADNFTVNSDCSINYDAEHINYYSDTVVTVEEGVTLTVANGGLFGSFRPSYEGDGETPPFPNGRVINNGKIIVDNGGALEADIDTNNGEIIVNNGGFSVVCCKNNGTVTVKEGGQYSTTMGRDAFNNGTVNIENGGIMESRFGSKIINEENGVINLDGTFNCGCLGMDGNDFAWFENNGTVNGNGSVILYEADRSVAPVGNMDGLIEVIMDELGQTSRFENWEDINIFKKLGVSDFNELKVALPSERTVAGEAVEGNMDVIIELENDITIPSGESIEYMTKFIVPEGITLTVSDGAVLSCGMENDGCVNVLSGGKLATTMGGAIINRNELNVSEGAELTSQMGGEVINENNATLSLDGTFNCGCFGMDGNDIAWFENSGTVNGSGKILLYQADSEAMPVSDMNALEEHVAQVTGETGNIGIAEACVIIFDTRGGSEIAPIYVEKGGYATAPALPQKDGMHFSAWYKDENLNNYFSFNNPINDNLTLYASWIIPVSVSNWDKTTSKEGVGGTYDVNFIDDGRGCTNMSFPEGNATLSLKAHPDAGYRFAGWYKGVYTGDSSTQHAEPLDLNNPENLISTDAEYTLTLEKSDVIIAVFEEIPNDGWSLYSNVLINGKTLKNPSETIKLVKGGKMFISFDTDYRNVNHGYAPLVGFSDCYEGGTLSSKGFSVTEGNASDFGLNYAAWGLDYDPHGFMLTAGNLPAGTKGTLDYYLYECENFSWETFDFINTPRALIKKLNFEVTSATPAPKPTPAPVSASKKANPLAVKAKKVTIKFKKLRKKNQSVALKKAMTVSKAQGTVTYAISSAKKGKKNFKKKFKINKKTGKITVKKGLKKGTYKLVIKVKAAGNSNYKTATKTVTVKIKVK